MKAWIIREVETTNLTHQEIKTKFIAKFGKQYEVFFDNTIREQFD